MNELPETVSPRIIASAWYSLVGSFLGWVSPVVVVVVSTMASMAREAPQWKRSEWFAERSITVADEPGVRIHVNTPLDEGSQRGDVTRLIVYALPNGNTIEQTLGCQLAEGIDWRYDTQHIAAQVRLLRSLMPEEHLVLLCAEAEGLSWPMFRKSQPDANTKIARMVDKWRRQFGDDHAKVMLAGHSGGGSFLWGLIESTGDIPSYLERLAFLDANYSFDAERHTAKLAHWLQSDGSHRLIVLAYDDREIVLDGKKVIGPTGGTYRATGRMREAMGGLFDLTDVFNPPFHETSGLDGRIRYYVHDNPENKILHTALVGDMNGLVHVATLGTPHERRWGKFGGPRAFTQYVQPAPFQDRKESTENKKQGVSGRPALAERGAGKKERLLAELDCSSGVSFPPRPANAMGGTAFVEELTGLSLDEREAAIFREISAGNFPQFLRALKEVTIRGQVVGARGVREVTATIRVMPDYLAVGSDADFVRMPMRPQTAQRIADRFGCVLPTRKMVDAIDARAEVHLKPHPMTQERESVATFLEHHRIIERQRGQKPLGLLVIGIKKDIVLSPRIFERPQRLAIYGWRQLDGQPIQPLTIVHWNRYVDYSHGARLACNTFQVDGREMKITDVLVDPHLCSLVSDEGPMNPPRYPPD